MNLNPDRLLLDAEERNERIEKQVGRVDRLRQDVVSSAFNDGVIVQIHCSWWRGFKVLQPEDLGMQPTKAVREFLREAVTLGGKRLLPRELAGKLKSCEVRGRKALAESSFKTLFGAFVPCTTYATWKEKFTGLQDEFYGLRDHILEEHDTIVKEIRERWLVNAPKLWRMANGKKTMPAEYATTTADRVAAQVRSRDDIMASFSYTQEVHLVPIPSEAQVDALRAEAADRARRLGKERAALVEAFEADIQTEMSGRRQQLVACVDGLQSQLSEAVCSMAVEVHNTVAGKTSVTQPTADKLRRLMTRIKDLNFVDDPQVNEWLGTIETTLEAKEVTPDSLTAALKKVAEASKEDLDAIRQNDASFSLVIPLKRKDK